MLYFQYYIKIQKWEPSFKLLLLLYLSFQPTLTEYQQCYKHWEIICSEIWYYRLSYGLCYGHKGLSSQSYGFSSSHAWMWELDYKESWAPKNWWFWTVVLEKTLESPLDCKEIKPVHPKGNQSWIFIGRTDAEAETPILWPPDAKNWLTEKAPESGKDWRQEEKGLTEDEMVGRHHWLNGMSLSKLQELVMDREAWLLQSMGLQRVGHNWVTEMNGWLLPSGSWQSSSKDKKLQKQRGKCEEQMVIKHLSKYRSCTPSSPIPVRLNTYTWSLCISQLNPAPAKTRHKNTLLRYNTIQLSWVHTTAFNETFICSTNIYLSI